MKTLTEKDLRCIEIAKKYKINNFALSFTNSLEDIKNFNLLLKIRKKYLKLKLKQLKISGIL